LISVWWMYVVSNQYWSIALMLKLWHLISLLESKVYFGIPLLMSNAACIVTGTRFLWKVSRFDMMKRWDSTTHIHEVFLQVTIIQWAQRYEIYFLFLDINKKIGEFNVEVSRVTSKKGLKIMLINEYGNCISNTSNVVYKEVFRNL
jgi:hypothetical protein